MDAQATAMHRYTPKLTAIDPRDLAVRSVDYYRMEFSDTAETRVNRTAHDPAGRVIDLWDPRLFLDATAPANLSSIHSLSGAALCTTSVDAGLRVSLFSEAGQPVHRWDGRGSRRWMHYDNQLRLSALFEQAVEGEAICAEHLSYAANDQAFADHNQCGRLIRHDDPAGVLLFNDYGLTGAVLEQVRCFTNEAPPGLATHSRVNPLGDPLSRTDAHGNEQRFTQTLDGHLLAVELRLSNTTERLPMVNAITYNAHGQVEKEVAGNGVITTLEYAAEDGRLQRLVSRLGQNDPLQDLRYAYDPVGNVLSIEDAALPIRYFANQRIEPVSHYCYDTLYRLIEATGWEAGAVKHGPATAMTADPAMPGNYRQTYHYDDGNNLLELTHVGPQNHGHRLVAAAHSNRCLPVRDGIEPGEEDFGNGFDANGNLLKLQPGQTLSWDVRNQLCEVRPVERDGAENDSERYVYGADGMRVHKVRSSQTNAQTVVIETRYLPGLEIRTHSGTGEVFHVISVQAGRSSVRVLHCESAPPKDSANDQYRFSLNDHLGSCTLELDSDGEVISQERYHPFGTTAWFAGRGEVETSRKTVRYSGKERDATGLYYYGFRYYVPWWQRWISPDPAGDIDGLNFYSMVINDPINKLDRDGLSGGEVDGSGSNESRYGPSSEKWKSAVFTLRGKLFPETRPKGLIHPMLGSKRATGDATEVLDDPSRITERSHKFRGVKYFSLEERKKYVVSVKNGLLHTAGGQLLTSSASTMVRGRAVSKETPKTTSFVNWKLTQMAYVLGWNTDLPSERQLLVYPHKANELHHSSGFGGGRVIDVGMMTIYEGKVVFVESKSGHYKPNMEQKIHTLHFLKQSGVDLSSTFISERILMVHAVPGDLKSPIIPDFDGAELYRADDFYKKRGGGDIFKAPEYDPEDPQRLKYQTQVYWPGN
ncbi:RHS repeat domain-containing protein [Pseudomonas sp. XS1P51]